MNQLYHIQGLCPRTDIDMGRVGFCVLLWPAWKDAIQRYPLTNERAQTAVMNMASEWLKGHMFDFGEIRVTWGEWGPEHITVPGNACGLDIDDGLGKPRNGKILLPHNVDSIHQAHLLLTVFLFFADTLVIDAMVRQYL